VQDAVMLMMIGQMSASDSNQTFGPASQRLRRTFPLICPSRPPFGERPVM